MYVYGYGMPSFDPRIPSTYQQEDVALEHFNIFRRVGKLPQDAIWGHFFRDEAAVKPARFRTRQAGSMLLAILQPGDMVIATGSDRIFASFDDAAEVLELTQQRRFRLVLLDDGVDSANSDTLLSPLMAMLKSLRASDRRRTKDVFEYRKRRGLPAGGKAPIGWEIVRANLDGINQAYFVPHNGARRVAQFIVEHYERWSGTFEQVAYWLNAQKVFRPDGKRWRKTAIFNWYHAAKANFPLPNGRCDAFPIPVGAMPARHHRFIESDDDEN
jgi:hypothetical protein